MELFKVMKLPKLGWLKNSASKSDAMLTFAAVSFVITSLCVLASVIESITVGTHEVKFRSADTALVSMYMASTFGAYVLRRNTKDKLEAGIGIKGE